MRRGILIFLLGVGAIAGFGAGFAHLWGYHHYGHGYGWHGDRDRFEEHVADVCVKAAERTLRERPAPAAAEPAKPAPAAQ